MVPFETSGCCWLKVFWEKCENFGRRMSQDVVRDAKGNLSLFAAVSKLLNGVGDEFGEVGTGVIQRGVEVLARANETPREVRDFFMVKNDEVVAGLGWVGLAVFVVLCLEKDAGAPPVRPRE